MAQQDPVSFAKRPETIGQADVTKPQTSAEYLASLDDGREVFIYGERVKQVTKHPAFRNTARMIARLYDALHDPKIRDKIIMPTDTGNGGFTHAFFTAPMSISTILTRPMPSAGTSSARSVCRSSITPSSIRLSIATGRRTKSPTC